MFRLTAAFAPANPVELAPPQTAVAPEVAKDTEVQQPPDANDGGVAAEADADAPAGSSEVVEPDSGAAS
jgi:hypothetical protein